MCCCKFWVVSALMNQKWVETIKRASKGDDKVQIMQDGPADKFLWEDLRCHIAICCNCSEWEPISPPSPPIDQLHTSSRASNKPRSGLEETLRQSQPDCFHSTKPTHGHAPDSSSSSLWKRQMRLKMGANGWTQAVGVLSQVEFLLLVFPAALSLFPHQMPQTFLKPPRHGLCRCQDKQQILKKDSKLKS